MLKVKFAGFGGYMDSIPCYEDEKGNLYFDENDGKNELNLYTGAYKDDCGEICGEPTHKVTEEVECDRPFARHARERDYRMLGRMESDCKYFLGAGCGYESVLMYGNIEKLCDEMENLYNSFSDEDKPEWITMDQIKDYRKRMQKIRR